METKAIYTGDSRRGIRAEARSLREALQTRIRKNRGRDEARDLRNSLDQALEATRQQPGDLRELRAAIAAARRGLRI